MVDGVKYLRTKNDTPILLVESPGGVDSILRYDASDAYNSGNVWLLKAYNELVSLGVDNLYYLSEGEIGMDED